MYLRSKLLIFSLAIEWNADWFQLIYTIDTLNRQNRSYERYARAMHFYFIQQVFNYILCWIKAATLHEFLSWYKPYSLWESATYKLYKYWFITRTFWYIL